jgi:hypothetical protein
LSARSGTRAKDTAEFMTEPRQRQRAERQAEVTQCNIWRYFCTGSESANAVLSIIKTDPNLTRRARIASPFLM